MKGARERGDQIRAEGKQGGKMKNDKREDPKKSFKKTKCFQTDAEPPEPRKRQFRREINRLQEHCWGVKISTITRGILGSRKRGTGGNR